jgi:hypothetical protein
MKFCSSHRSYLPFSWLLCLLLSGCFGGPSNSDITSVLEPRLHEVLTLTYSRNPIARPFEVQVELRNLDVIDKTKLEDGYYLVQYAYEVHVYPTKDVENWSKVADGLVMVMDIGSSLTGLLKMLSVGASASGPSLELSPEELADQQRRILKGEWVEQVGDVEIVRKESGWWLGN